MSSSTLSPLMWGRTQYPHPGKHLGTGNRCGHDPRNPSWDRFKTSDEWRNPPKFIQRLMDGMTAYYSAPERLPTLFNPRGKTNQDGSLRRNRSEAREAESLVMNAILRLTDYTTLKVGTPLPDGGFINRSCTEIARVAGFLDTRNPDQPEPTQRFWRAFRRLKLSGAFDVHVQYEELADGSKRARPAIKNLNRDFLVLIGRTSYAKLEAFRKQRSDHFKQLRAEWVERNPDLVASQNDGKTALDRLRSKQIFAPLAKAMKGKPKAAPTPQQPQDEQYSRQQNEFLAKLMGDQPGKPSSWYIDELKRAFPSLEQWKRQQPPPH